MICAAVKITVSGVSQVKGGCIRVTVPKEEIRGIKLCYDSRARYPFLQFLFGFALIATGVVLVIATVIMHTEIFTIWLLIAVGLWLLAGVFRGRYSLLVITDKGAMKIFFDGSADVREIERFARRANMELGYMIDLSIMETMYFHAGQQ